MASILEDKNELFFIERVMPPTFNQRNNTSESMKSFINLTLFFIFLLALSMGAEAKMFAKTTFVSAQEGKRYKVLHKGNGKSLKNQIEGGNANTIFEIRYDFDLGGAIINIPDNCVLKLVGGSLKNGTLVGQNTILEGQASVIMNTSDLFFSNPDSFDINALYLTKDTDITAIAQRMLDVFNIVSLQVGNYYLSSPLIIRSKFAIIKGAGKGRTRLMSNKPIDYAIRTAYDSEVDSPGEYYNASFVEISDLMIDGGPNKQINNGILLDGPSCTVNNCYVTRVQNIGVKLCEWCNNMFNCIITHCDIGALITQRANAVNVSFNRIESNSINIVAHGYRGLNISNNTMEGAKFFNIVVGSGQNCNIKDNYFEGGASSITEMLSTTELRKLSFEGNKELKGLLWIGSLRLNEIDNVSDINYLIGSPNAPSSVIIQGNYIDIHSDETTLPTPDVYFVLIGSCADFCSIQNNSFTRPQNAVCGFFDTDNAILGDLEVINNYVAGTSGTMKSLDAIWDKLSKTGWRAKNHFVGNLQLERE